MNRRDRGKNRGVTLVEVLVAFVLLGVGLAGVLEISFDSIRTLARNRREYQAGYLLQDRLATLEGAGYEALTNRMRSLAPSADAPVVSLFPDLAPMQRNSDFRWNASLKQEAPDSHPRIRIEVTLKWLDRGSERVKKAVGYAFAP